MVVYENGDPKFDPQILGAPYHEDPKKIPLVSETGKFCLNQNLVAKRSGCHEALFGGELGECC